MSVTDETNNFVSHILTNNAFVSHVGRVVQLSGLLSSPELNGKFAVIMNHSPDTDRSAVQTLATPDKCDTICTISVNRENAKLCTPDWSADQYVQLKGCSSKCIPLSIPGMPYIRGEKVPFEGIDNLAPKTVLSGLVHISAQDDNSPTVIEDIHFAPTGDDCNVFCWAGKHIIFRRCKFTGKESGLVLGGVDDFVVKVVCESCLFENSRVAGIFITNASHLTLINCIVRNMNHGIIAKHGGTVKMTHTTIGSTLSTGTCSGGRTGRVVATNCCISDSKGEAFYVFAGSSAVIRGCYISKCGQRGISVEGPKGTTVHVEDTLISECGTGVHICSGRVKVSANNVEIVKSSSLDFEVSYFVTGDVTVNNCRFRIASAIFDHTVPDEICTITVDGVNHQVRHQYDLSRSEEARDEDRSKMLHDMRERATLQQQRAFKKSFGFEITCANCSTAERTEEKFQHCSKCKEVCYCSRDCQVAHWKEHKKTCGSPRARWV